MCHQYSQYPISSNLGDSNCSCRNSQPFENPLDSDTLCTAAIVTYLSLIYQRCSKAKTAKLGSPVSVIHCSVVFAKDHRKLMAIIFGRAFRIQQ